MVMVYGENRSKTKYGWFVKRYFLPLNIKEKIDLCLGKKFQSLRRNHQLWNKTLKIYTKRLDQDHKKSS